MPHSLGGKKNSHLEYVPITVMALAGGFGLGIGYEARIRNKTAWRLQGSGGFVPAGR